jgi:hypothetical protein
MKLAVGPFIFATLLMVTSRDSHAEALESEADALAKAVTANKAKDGSPSPIVLLATNIFVDSAWGRIKPRPPSYVGKVQIGASPMRKPIWVKCISWERGLIRT